MKSKDPTDRMGVYKRLSDVPPQHRLDSYLELYDGRDVWSSFLTDYLFELHDSARFKEEVHRAGRRWKSHMEACGRHHALARPADVDAWCSTLLDTVSVETAYNCYWVRLERFYSWLQWHRDHPHTYHPVLMAAANGDATEEIWAEKIRRGTGGEPNER